MLTRSKRRARPPAADTPDPCWANGDRTKPDYRPGDEVVLFIPPANTVRHKGAKP